MARLSTGYHYWRVLAIVMRKNPGAFRDAISLMALYLHFQKFRDVILKRVSKEIEKLEREGDPRLAPAAPEPAARVLEGVGAPTPLPVGSLN